MTARITIPSDRIATFWRLLDDGANAVQEREPGSGVGRILELFSDREVQSVACRFGASLDRLDQFDAAFFRISPSGSAAPRPAAAADAGDLLAGARRRRIGPGAPAGQSLRGLRGDQQQRVPQPRPMGGRRIDDPMTPDSRFESATPSRLHERRVTHSLSGARRCGLSGGRVARKHLFMSRMERL